MFGLGLRLLFVTMAMAYTGSSIADGSLWALVFGAIGIIYWAELCWQLGKEDS